MAFTYKRHLSYINKNSPGIFVVRVFIRDQPYVISFDDNLVFLASNGSLDFAELSCELDWECDWEFPINNFLDPNPKKSLFPPLYINSFI